MAGENTQQKKIELALEWFAENIFLKIYRWKRMSTVTVTGYRIK